MHQHEGQECRLGNKSERPFTGLTVCLDFAAHVHKDLFDLPNGCSVITTLTNFEKKDMQYHVFPSYILHPDEQKTTYEAPNITTKNSDDHLSHKNELKYCNSSKNSRNKQHPKLKTKK